MGFLKKSLAWAVLLCLVLSMGLTVMPMAAEVEENTADTYVYYWNPAAEAVPEYYERYARPYMLFSGHNVSYKEMGNNGFLYVRFFNVVNMEELISDQSEAPAGGYATTGAFCADAETYIVDGTAYRRMNLEDGYFNTNSNTKDGTVDARKIRAVLRHSMPNLADLPAFEKKVNAYLSDTHGEEAVLVKDLHGSELMSATQSAIWHYANGFDFGAPYPYRSSERFENWGENTIASSAARISYPDYPSSFVDIADDTTGSNINGVYQYLLSLPGEDPKDVVLTDDAVSLAEAAVSGSGNDLTVTLFINIDGTINGDDDVTLSVKCGKQTQRFQLGAVNTLEKQEDGLYAVTFKGVSRKDCDAVELVLSGEQIIDDVCFFEAKPTEDTDGRKTSQNLAGYGHGIAPVNSRVTVSVPEDNETLELTKLDERTGNPLSGVTFVLYKKQEKEDLKLHSYVTDAQGKISVSVTDPEDYYFVETGALAGYEPISGSIAPGRVSNDWNTGMLELSKKLINTTPAQVGETFDFELTLDLSTAPVMSNGLSWMTGKYILQQLECSKELTFTADGSTLTAAFTLNADETVTVAGIPLGATYTLKEVLTEEDQAWFESTARIGDGEAVEGGVAKSTVGKNNTVVITNSVVTGLQLKTGTLGVGKELVDAPASLNEQKYTFRVTVDLSEADVYQDPAPWMTDEYLLKKITSKQPLKWTKTGEKTYTTTISLKHGQLLELDGVPQGSGFFIEEQLTNVGRRNYRVTTAVSANGGDAVQEQSTVASGNMAESNNVIFINQYVGPIPAMGDSSLTVPMVLCLISVMAVGLLLVNKRRILGA